MIFFRQRSTGFPRKKRGVRRVMAQTRQPRARTRDTVTAMACRVVAQRATYEGNETPRALLFRDESSKGAIMWFGHGDDTHPNTE